MTKIRTAVVSAALILFVGSVSRAQTGTEGHVNYLEYALSSLDPYTSNPSGNQQQWMQGHFSDMVVWSPYFNSRTWWYPNATVYQDLYGVPPGSDVANNHPNWILHDSSGHWLYIPWACGGGTCPQYAGDIANPAFRQYWIDRTKSVMSAGGYAGLFIDDTNFEFRVSDGNQNQVPPIDSNTGQTMSWDSWRNYVATFLEEIRSALPNTKIMENAIWYSGPSGVPGQDQYIQRGFAAANKINLERGVANDDGMTGGTGFWSVYNFFAFIDRIHSQGRGINYEEYQLNQGGLEYGLASYFMISNGQDSLGDGVSTPDNFFGGYTVDLGPAKGGRSYNNGVFRRDFNGGIVLMGEPGLGGQTINLPGSFQRLDGSWVSSVNIGSRQGIILKGANATTAAPVSSNPTPTPAPTPAPTPTPAPAPTSAPTSAPASNGNHRISDLTPTYVTNGWGTLQVNRSIGGNTLTLGGVKYSNGLGVHAYSEQRFALNGGCSSLTAMVGIDDEIPFGLGSMTFQVWGDGMLLFDSGYMSGGTAPRQVNVDVSGRQSISLVGTNGIYLAADWAVPFDHGDWGNAALTCSW
jgi:hypothetical protein